LSWYCNWEMKEEKMKKGVSDLVESKKTDIKSKEPVKPPKEQQWRPKQNTSAAPPVISDEPKEKEREISKPLSQKSQESQGKNQNTSGSRTTDRETRRNELPKQNKQHVNWRLINVRSDWQEF
jgi:hypothetical protein